MSNLYCTALPIFARSLRAVSRRSVEMIATSLPSPEFKSYLFLAKISVLMRMQPPKYQADRDDSGTEI